MELKEEFPEQQAGYSGPTSCGVCFLNFHATYIYGPF
jgi:hypothetical protein